MSKKCYKKESQRYSSRNSTRFNQSHLEVRPKQTDKSKNIADIRDNFDLREFIPPINSVIFTASQ
ncbi:hypothetical protein [Vibrio fortis]|uniref:hypothetical protein n=1 Tax=Vibrio fortis TaxID=212667 RepID=UPI000AE0B1C8|nr:hypothetical protein [Vibrio fortis]